MYNEFKDKGFEVLSIDGIGDPVEEIQKFMKDKGARFTVGLNKSPSDVVGLYKVSGYPTNYIIDREGNVAAKIVGYDLNKLRRAVQRAGIE